MLGLRLVAADGTVLAEFPRPPARARHGHPQANLFDQPELEGLLRANLAAHPLVDAQWGTEVVGLAPSGSDVRVDVVDAAGRRGSIVAQYVLGCDGANSSVRAAMGARLRDLRFQQRWLVVDLATDAELAVWDGVSQVADAHRPATFMRIGPRRYRWEFRLTGSEAATDFADLSALRPLLGHWVADVPADALHVVRVAEYTFRAAVADRWRRDRMFVLGDAAHLLPPFTGQGLGAGLRDAHNLAWKLAGVIHGTLPEAVLDSYQLERAPHVRSLIRLAKIIGSAMTAGGRAGDVLRQAVAPRLHLVPGLRERAADSTTPRLRRSLLVAGSPVLPSLAGSLCPNVELADGVRFDDATEGRFAMVSTRPLTIPQQREVERVGAVSVYAAPGSALHAWLAQHRVRAALVRPDLVVLRAARRPESLLASLHAVGIGARAVTEPAPGPVASGARRSSRAPRRRRPRLR